MLAGHTIMMRGLRIGRLAWICDGLACQTLQCRRIYNQRGALILTAENSDGHRLQTHPRHIQRTSIENNRSALPSPPLVAGLAACGTSDGTARLQGGRTPNIGLYALSFMVLRSGYSYGLTFMDNLRRELPRPSHPAARVGPRFWCSAACWVGAEPLSVCVIALACSNL